MSLPADSGVPPVRFESPLGDPVLERYPPGDRRLQAWDGADRLMLQAWTHAPAPTGPVWVVNDPFGALALPLLGSGVAVLLTQDRWCEGEAVRRNLVANGIAGQGLTALAPMAPLPSSVQRVCVKMPKDVEQLAFFLATPGLPAGAEVWIAGMDKHLPRGLAAQLEGLLDELERPPGRFKAHLFKGRLRVPAKAQEQFWRQVSGLPGLPVGAWPGVFGRRHADPGGRFLIDSLPPLRGRVADLGCGNGMVGLSILQQNTDTSVWFCDDSGLSVDSARRNVAVSGTAPERAHFHQGDGLSGLAGRFDHVVLNPPFHQGHAVDPQVGQRLVADAVAHLQPEGRLHLVINRHLDYRGTLRQLCRDVRRVAENRKFLILSAAPAVPPEHQ